MACDETIAQQLQNAEEEASAVAQILALAEVEFKAWRLAKELKKTVVRVNALQQYYVPEYTAAIKQTEAAL